MKEVHIFLLKTQLGSPRVERPKKRFELWFNRQAQFHQSRLTRASSVTLPRHYTKVENTYLLQICFSSSLQTNEKHLEALLHLGTPLKELLSRSVSAVVFQRSRISRFSTKSTISHLIVNCWSVYYSSWLLLELITHAILTALILSYFTELPALSLAWKTTLTLNVRCHYSHLPSELYPSLSQAPCLRCSAVESVACCPLEYSNCCLQLNSGLRLRNSLGETGRGGSWAAAETLALFTVA